MQLVIDTNGVSIRVRGGSFLVSGKAGKRSISPKLLSGILILSDCLISSQAVRLAVMEAIPIQFFDDFGGPLGCLWSARLESMPLLRRNQVLFEADRPQAAEWASGLYELKVRGQLDNLLHFKAEKKSIADMEQRLKVFNETPWDRATAFEPELMLEEAQMARVYWESVADLLPKGYAFEKRSRQPAQDMFNAALNYWYGMLYNVVEGAIFAAGLDPYLGIVHADEYNKPTLAFDLIEPFRPWCDRLLMEFCLDHRLGADHFEPKDEGMWLSKEGKRLLIPAFESLMLSERSWQHRNASARNHIFQYAGTFAAQLRDYQPTQNPVNSNTA